MIEQWKKTFVHFPEEEKNFKNQLDAKIKEKVWGTPFSDKIWLNNVIGELNNHFDKEWWEKYIIGLN